MLLLRYCLVGPPCATGWLGRADGWGGIEPGRAFALEAAGGVAIAGAGWMVDRCSVWLESMAGLTEAGGGLLES